MQIERGEYQGLLNIVRFNWPYYVLALSAVLICIGSLALLEKGDHWVSYLILVLVIVPTTVSLLASHYIYDRAGLYQLNWLDEHSVKRNLSVLNVNAGYDEISNIINQKFNKANLKVCDFYEPERHTEKSIKRARKVYQPYPETTRTKSTSLPFPSENFDVICVMFAAHEIRDAEERIRFLQELRRVCKTNGSLFITEHLRDSINFCAYTIGFLHFYSRRTWLRNFSAAKLKLRREIKSTPFVSTFILNRHGISS